MYGNSVKQMKVKFIISIILGVGYQFISCLVGLGSGMDLFSVLGLLAFGVLIVPIEVLGAMLNIKPILKGIFFPIPMLSMVIESFKGYVMGFKAIIWVIKNWNSEE